MTAVVEAPAGSGLGTAIRDASPLLASIGLLMAGNGLTSTLLGTRAGLEGFRPSVVGVVLAGYYVGFLAGSVLAPATITRVGHVRVFAGLASLASGAVLVHVVRPEPLTWFVLRAVSGMCISALYVVCETWLNGVATNRSRGGLLATYMVVVSGSLLVGQLLFAVADPGGFGLFVLASVLVSLAVVPVSLASFPAPAVPSPTPISLRRLVGVAPLAAVGAALSGFIGAAMLGAGVVYAADAGFGSFATGAFIGAALAGGVLLQFPLGRWSDKVDRRFVMAVAAVVAAGVAVAASMVNTDRRIVLIALTTIAGGSAFPLYSLSNAHLNDYLDADLVVAGGARMVLINGAGSVAGPVVGAAAVGLIGPESLFLVLAGGYLPIGLYAAYRMTRRAAPDETDRATFQVQAVGVGPTAVALAEPDVDGVHPPSAGLFDGTGATVVYREQGTGSAVVLLGEVVSGHEAWDDLIRALAANGVWAIAPDAIHGDDPPSAPSADGVLEVLRHLEIPAATFVGGGDHTEMASTMAEEHPDRTEAVVLVRETADGHDEAVEEVQRPTLVLERSWLESPEHLADEIATFVRHLPAPHHEAR
ncbi:MAG: MFS transporter [Acidimicrobiales bacterium]|nr:MFS transporter [Acidimicrobiales bacterium]